MPVKQIAITPGIKNGSAESGAQVRACGLCGSKQFGARPEFRRRLPGTQESEVYLCRCSACGLATFQPQLSPEQLVACYDRDYYQSGYLAVAQLRRSLIQR